MLLFLSTKELLHRGHQVQILLDAPAAVAEEFRRNHLHNLPNANHFELVTMGELLGHDEAPAAGPANWYEQKSHHWFQAIRAWLGRVNLDVLEFPDFYGFGHTAISAHRWLGFGAPTQFVVRLHTTMEQLQEQEIGCYVDHAALLMQEQERLALRYADAILAPSESRGQATASAYGLPRQQVIVSPPVVDTTSITPRQSDHCDTILFVGRLFHVKGADTFVDAAVHLLETRPVDPKVRFVLVGYDSNMGPRFTPFEAYLRKRIPHRLANRFEFTGHLQPAEVAKWLARSLCYVCPSRTESFAYTVHEAAAAGVPLVLTDTDAFADFFTHGVNCLKFNGNASDLADKLWMLLDDPQLLNQLASRKTLVTEPLRLSYEQTAARARESRPATPHPVDPPGANVLAVVLKDAPGPQSGRFTPAEQAISTAWPGGRIIHLEPADASSPRTVPLLGRLWSASGEPSTQQALMLCLQSDRFDVEYLRSAAQAMASHPELAFVSPFDVPEGSDDAYVCEPLDVELSVWPILHRTALTRSIMRTPPGLWLGDLFDRRVETYGEIDYLWRLQDQDLGAFQWPTPGARLGHTEIVLDNLAILQSMLLRGRNRCRMSLQSRFLAQMMGKTTESLVVGTQPSALAPSNLLRRLLRRLKRAWK